jgi:hypothetical protein
MKQRNVLTVVIIALVVLVISLFAFHWNTSIPVPKKTVRVEIVDFSITRAGLPAIVGVTVSISFNLTMRNTGTENISQLNVQLALFNNGTKTVIDESNLFSYPSNFTLNSGETSSKEIVFLVDLITEQQMINSHQNFLATIISNGTVLDERTLFNI